jgi:hypothetical protein
MRTGPLVVGGMLLAVALGCGGEDTCSGCTTPHPKLVPAGGTPTTESSGTAKVVYAEGAVNLTATFDGVISAALPLRWHPPAQAGDAETDAGDDGGGAADAGSDAETNPPPPDAGPDLGPLGTPSGWARRARVAEIQIGGKAVELDSMPRGRTPLVGARLVRCAHAYEELAPPAANASGPLVCHSAIERPAIDEPFEGAYETESSFEPGFPQSSRRRLEGASPSGTTIDIRETSNYPPWIQIEDCH